MKFKRLSTILSLVLSIVLVVTSITFTPVKASKIIDSTFTYPHLLDEKTEIESIFYYSDDYFTQSSYVYNNHLATMSACMASASIGCNTGAITPEGRSYKGYSQDVEAVLKEVGFDSIFVNEDYNTKPKKDSIGFAFAKKTINADGKDYTLIAVNFRNAMYELEWVSNLNIGTSDIHAGFKESGDKAIAGLKQYITDQGIKGDVKIWATGYSRGAGVANYVASKLDDSFYMEDISLTRENIYAYTFGTPNNTKSMNYKQSKFKNIFNILSPYDFIPKIPPEQWGWHMYGEIVYLPSHLSDSNYAAKKARAQKFMDLMLPNTPVVGDIVPGYKLDLTSLDPSQMGNLKIVEDSPKEVATIVDDIITAISTVIENEENLENVKPVLEKAFDVLYEATDEQKKVFSDYVMAKAQEEGIGSLIMDIMFQGDKTANIVIDGFNEAGIPLDDPDTFKTKFNKLVLYLFQAVTNDFNNMNSNACTIYKNKDPFVSNHANYGYLAWLQAMDSYYKLDSDIPIPNPTPVVRVPDKAKVSSAKKSGKKIKVKIKKIKGAKGYQVVVSKKKKGKAIYKKFVKKTKVTLKSKKFKKKKLYVKIRAYTLDGKTKVYGKWSKVTKVK